MMLQRRPKSDLPAKSSICSNLPAVASKNSIFASQNLLQKRSLYVVPHPGNSVEGIRPTLASSRPSHQALPATGSSKTKRTRLYMSPIRDSRRFHE
jgi:hypothetical protein